jgi:hypothetical protein
MNGSLWRQVSQINVRSDVGYRGVELLQAVLS